MKTFRNFLAIAFAVLLYGMPSVATGKTDIREMAALQATMQQYVDRKTIDGAYLYFDEARAEVRELFPMTGHPMVMQFDKHFVLCFDFVDGKGEKVEIDYYIADRGDDFVVFHEAVGTRKVLEAMIKKGRVRPVN